MRYYIAIGYLPLLANPRIAMTAIAVLNPAISPPPRPGAGSEAGAGQADQQQLQEERLEQLQEQQEVAQLRARDQEVRAHERAHLLAAGPYANGPPSFQLVRGPDGRFYAIGGSVSIDTSPVPDDPEATVEKAETIKRAALAPMQPSSQDFQVAAQAEAMRLKAQAEVRAERQQEREQQQDETSSPTGDQAAQAALAIYRSVSAMA